jgi:hypothetical protein
MSAGDSQALVDLYGKVPPPANSPELDAAKMTEEIKNLWTQTGIFKWEENFPEKLLEELRKAKEGLPGKPADARDKLPADAVQARKQELEEAKASGGKNRIRQAEIDLYNTEMLAQDTTMAGMSAADLQSERMSEIRQGLIKSGLPWDKDRVTLFTGDANPFTKNDDEESADRFMAYGKEPAGFPAYQAFERANDIFKTFTPEQIIKLNENNDINKAIPDVMTDRTGQLLLHAVEGLYEALNNVTARVEETP